MANPNQLHKQNNDLDETALLDAALNALAKAMKAMTFYPPEHPQRDESLSATFIQLASLANEKELILLWSRDACTVSDRPLMKSASATAKALAREMLTRKLQRLIILPEISQPDLKTFLAIVTADPATIYAGGGIEAEMLRAGITTIGANEVDLSLLRSTEPEENTGAAEETVDDAAASDEPVQDEPEQPVEEPLDIQFSLLGMDILLGMLKAEPRETEFLQLAREIIDAAEELKRQEAYENLLPVLEALLDVHASELRPTSQKEFIRYALEQIISGGMTTYLLDRIEERSAENEMMLDKLCATIGQTLAYPLIQRLCVAETLHARKTIATALTVSGEAAVPALIPMLKDERWYVVRNMVTILGEIGSMEAVTALQMTARHAEPKVRKETIKSFMKINPKAAEPTLIALIDDEDSDVVRHAIYCLGASRSKAAVRRLQDIVTSSDPLLKTLPLKKNALAALGKIGDRQATSALMDILVARGWLAPGRWQELKIAAATALGQLGDETAIGLLKKLARRNSPLGSACGDAADNLERLAK
jgi:HEAT repeat protein